MKTNLTIRVLALNYIAAVVVTLIVLFFGLRGTLWSDLYGVLFLGFIPVFGGIHGITLAKAWGGFQSAVGRGIMLLSLGLISWGIGTYIFSGVYNFILSVEVPYPSLADVGYILALPLWAAAMIQLSRATGAKYGLRKGSGKIALLAIPTVVILISYYLLVVVARGGAIPTSDEGLLKLFFDLAYPIGDVVILTLATLVYGLSYSYFGGMYKKAIYTILFGFVLMYVADFSFSYTTTLETWYPGDWVDLLFTTAVLTLALGVAMLDPRAQPQTRT
ncbi:hypothetical protein HYW60_00560 [Candidatus Kaiserbacteria bacterium]|nr:hypothetical protein [Candidatus Kaiserbacteria bacterium]